LRRSGVGRGMASGGSAMQEVYGGQDVKQRKGIYTYEAPWTIYGMNWSVRTDSKFRLAVGSFIEEFRNKVKLRSVLRKCYE
jgi:hypothetical protein